MQWQSNFHTSIKFFGSILSLLLLVEYLLELRLSERESLMNDLERGVFERLLSCGDKKLWFKLERGTGLCGYVKTIKYTTHTTLYDLLWFI